MPGELQRMGPSSNTSHMWPIIFKYIYNFSSSVAKATGGRWRWQSLDSCRSRTFPIAAESSWVLEAGSISGSMHCRVCSSIPGPHPLGARCGCDN